MIDKNRFKYIPPEDEEDSYYLSKISEISPHKEKLSERGINRFTWYIEDGDKTVEDGLIFTKVSDKSWQYEFISTGVKYTITT